MSSNSMTETMVDFWQVGIEGILRRRNCELIINYLLVIILLQTMSRKNSDPSGANPMLYDPLQDGGIGETSKMKQYIAASIGEF